RGGGARAHGCRVRGRARRIRGGFVVSTYELELIARVNIGSRELAATVLLEVIGERRPASWDRYGGEPAEEPEVSFLSLTHEGRRLPASALSEGERARLIEEARAEVEFDRQFGGL